MLSRLTDAVDRLRGKPVDPKDLVRKWQAEIRSEQRGMERQIRDLQREEKAAQKNVRDAAKRGDAVGAKTLAREIVRCRAAASRLYVHKARLVDMNARLAEQLGTVKVVGSLQKSSEVMKLVNGLVKVPQLMGTMRAMSREMAKAGMIDEAVGDAVDSAVAEEGEDERAEEEVDRVLMEVAGADMETLAAAAAPRAKQREKKREAEEEVEEDGDDLRARLEAVRS